MGFVSKRVLLVNVPYRHVYEDIEAGIGAYLPLGLAYIAAVLRERGHEVRAVDYGVERYSDHSFSWLLKNFEPHVIGFSFMTASHNELSRLVKIARGVCPSALAVGGGPHASALPERTISEAGLDAVVRGEGEIPMLEIADGRSFQEIRGLTYRDRFDIKSNPRVLLMNDLDQVPFPARDLFPVGRYRPHAYYRRNVAWANVITARGCPYQCIFCASASVFEHRYRVRSVENVVAEIQSLIEKHRIKDITFVDDEFLISRKRVVELCSRIIAERFDVTWYCFARVDHVDRDLLRLMRRAGCYYILYGVESGDPGILEATRKGITLEQATRAMRWTREAGIVSCATFMIGLPSETLGSIRTTISFAKEIDPDWAFFNITVPLPGSPLFAMAKKRGWLLSEDFENFTAMSTRPVYHPSALSGAELTHWAARAHLEFYSQPDVIWRRIHGCRSPGELLALLSGLKAGLRHVGRWQRRRARVRAGGIA